MARLQEQYQQTVVPKLKEQFGYANVMQVPRITKITLNMGVGEAVARPLPMVSPGVWPPPKTIATLPSTLPGMPASVCIQSRLQPDSSRTRR